ncbi:MAG TPA: glutamine amidotransferase [Steroidobacteraceae bacterium]|nr:glutamine amidotransferase [Steroidobacteraceae bacterium]
MPIAVAMTHVPFEDLGSLNEVLLERGFTIHTVDACTADRRSIETLNPDLLVVMGGPIGAYESQVYPFLASELALLRRRLQARLPTLGICLGAQLMAAALGAAVFPGGNGKEIGWAPIIPGRDVAACPAMLELLTPGVHVLHWHGDTFDLPPDAAHLAATARYPHQAFAVGPQALALQFHPEVQATALERWYVGHACELGAARIDVAQLRGDSARHAPLLQQAARRFWRGWLQQAIGR